MTCRHIGTVTAVIAAVFSFACRAAEQPRQPELLLNQADLDTLKRKVDGPFAEQWVRWLGEADKLVAQPVDLPPRGGNWSHNYVCPEHGARLTQGKKIGPWQWEHICPVGNHVLRGDPAKATTDFDGNAIREVHFEYARGVVTLGVAYRMTGNARYALRAKEILLAYAQKYRSYPIHDGKGKLGTKGGGHVATQPLTEAEWLISLTQGADLVWDTLSEEERTAVADKIMRPALDEVILTKNFGIQNMQCWDNSAIGLVGYLLGDEKLIHTAIDDPKTGFRQQIAQGVQDDGMWLEGASGYHYFAIEGLLPLAEAARHHGIDLYSSRFKSMFNAPLEMAMPDLRLPNFNDSSIIDIAGNSDVYDLAYARWKDPAFLPLFADGKRSGRLAILYGEAQLPRASATTRPMGSHNSPTSGYATLQCGVGREATWLCLKYGPHGGMHGHFDKNSFILYAAGEIIAADAGSHRYGSPLHAGWDKTTIAHNTLAVDQASQAPATGACLAFGNQAGVDYVMTDAGAIYPDKDVKFVRTVAMIDAGTIIGIDRITTGGKDHTLDIAFHLPGKWSNLPAGEPWKSNEKIGYPFIEPATIRQSKPLEPVTLNVINHGRAVALTLLGGMPTDIITGAGVGESTEDRVPVAIFRRTGGDAAYIWSISLDGPKPATVVLPSPPGTTAIQIGGVQLTVSPAARSVIVRKSPG
jgi:hypothetical protein